MAEPPVKLKDITDAEKPWFDYVGYLLRITAWFLAIAYAAHQLWRPRPPGMDFPYTQWTAVFLAACFGVFLIVRFMSMSIAMTKNLSARYESGSVKDDIVKFTLHVWLIFGVPGFMISVTSEIVELYLEKFK